MIFFEQSALRSKVQNFSFENKFKLYQNLYSRSIAILIGLGVLILVVLITWLKIKAERRQTTRDQINTGFIEKMKRNMQARGIMQKGTSGLTRLMTTRPSISSSISDGQILTTAPVFGAFLGISSAVIYKQPLVEIPDENLV